MTRTNRTRKERRFTKKMQIKLLAVFAFILLFLIIILIRIVYINVKSGNKYAKQVLSQENYDSQTLYARRGEIQDANGRLLAYSEKVYTLVLDCYAVNQDEDYMEPTIEALTAVFDLEADDLRTLITDEKTKNSQYQRLLRQVTADQKAEYEAYVSLSADRELTKAERKKLQNVTGVWFEEDYIRKYPLSSLASNVIGFTNSEGGVVGLEAYYDTQLEGTNGRVFGYLNENEEYQKKTIAPENGYTLQTSLDINIQQIVEKYIAEFDEQYGTDNDDGTAKHGAENVGVVVMDPNTGGILAMATNSSFDLNNPDDLSDWYTVSEISGMTDAEMADALSGIWSNFCVSDGIEPGSTFKPVTIASALECGAITAYDSWYCDGGEFITDTEIHCDAYPGSHGMQTLADVLKNSCNDALMQIGARMGVTRFIRYQSLFNFGKLTGIDLPNEASGAVYTKETMNEVELATCTFGQGLTCTMIQEIAAFSAVVNGGYYYQPHVVDKILDEAGHVIQDSSSLLLKQTVSGEVSDLLKEYLEGVVKEGTGRKSQVPGYRIGGKTGTAEKIDYVKGGRADGKYLVSFIGAVPINDPQVVIYVVVDEPNVADQADSSYAQYLFQSIATEVLPYMNIYPTEEISEEQLAALGLTQKDVSSDAVYTFGAFDSNGIYYSDARVSDGKVVDSSGNELSGAYSDDDGTVYDAYMNPVATVDVIESAGNAEEDIDPTADNPDIALPPSGESSDGGDSTVWDGTATDGE